MNKQTRENIKIYLASGYKIKKEDDESILLVRHKDTILGHALIALCTIWWFPLVINCIYHWTNIEKKEIKK